MTTLTQSRRNVEQPGIIGTTNQLGQPLTTVEHTSVRWALGYPMPLPGIQLGGSWIRTTTTIRTAMDGLRVKTADDS